jgi:hypothetical protein
LQSGFVFQCFPPVGFDKDIFLRFSTVPGFVRLVAGIDDLCGSPLLFIQAPLQPFLQLCKRQTLTLEVFHLEFQTLLTVQGLI